MRTQHSPSPEIKQEYFTTLPGATTVRSKHPVMAGTALLIPNPACLLISFPSFSRLQPPWSLVPQTPKLTTNSRLLYGLFPLPPALNVDSTILLFPSQLKEVMISDSNHYQAGPIPNIHSLKKTHLIL